MTIEHEVKAPEVGPNADAVTSLTRGRGPRRGNLEDLLKYWRPIMRKPGGFRRCVVTLMDKPQFGGRPQRICAWLHHELTGKWPNEGNHHGGRGGSRRGRRGTASRVRRAVRKDVNVNLLSIKSVARDSREFGGVLTQPIAGRQAAVDYKAAMFLQSEQGMNAIRVKKVGAFAAGSRTGAYLQGAGSYVLPGDFSDIRSPVRAQIYETLTPGSLRLRRPNFGLPSRPGRRSRGEGARNKFRCPPGFEKGGTFTNSNFSTCGAQVLAIPKFGPGAFSVGAERDLARLAESADLVRQIGDLRNNRSAYDIIRAAQIPVAPKKGSDTLRQTAVELVLARIGAEEFGARVVRRDGVILENVVPFSALAQFDEFDDFVDGSLIARYTTGQIGADSVPTLTTGLRDVYIAIGNEGALKVSRVGGELKPQELSDLRRLLPTLARRSSDSIDPSKAVREFAERSDGRFSVEFGSMQNNRFSVDTNKNQLVSVAAPGRSPTLVPLWVYETFLSRSAPRRPKGSVVYERVGEEKTARLFSIQGKSAQSHVIVGDPTYFKTIRSRGQFAASFFDVDEKVTLSRRSRRLGSSVGETGGSVAGRGARAVFDDNISRFRCPPGTRYGGRITDQFGRNCGYSLPNRIVSRLVDTSQAVEAAFANRNRVSRRSRPDSVEITDGFVEDLHAVESSMDAVMDDIDAIVDTIDPADGGKLGPSISDVAAGTARNGTPKPPDKAWLAELQKLRNIVNNEEFDAADIGLVRGVFQRLERAAGVEAGRLTVTPPKTDRDRSFTDRVQGIVEEMLGRIIGVPAVSDNQSSRRDRSAPQVRARRNTDVAPNLNIPGDNVDIAPPPTSGSPASITSIEEDLDNDFLDLIQDFHQRAQEFNVANGGRTADFFASLSDEEVEDFLRAFQDVDDPEPFHVDIIDRFQAELELRRRSDNVSQLVSLKNRAEEFRSQNRTDEFFEGMDDVQLRDNYDVLRDATKLSPEEREFLARIEDQMRRRGIMPNDKRREAERYNMARWAWNGRKRRQGLREFGALEGQALDNVAIQAQNEFQDLSNAWRVVLGKDNINDFDASEMRRFIGGLTDGGEKRLWVSRYNDWLELSNAVHAFRADNDREMHLRAAIDNLSRLSPNRRESLLRAARADGRVDLLVPDTSPLDFAEVSNLTDRLMEILNFPPQFQRDRPLGERDIAAIGHNLAGLNQMLAAGADGNLEAAARADYLELAQELERRNIERANINQGLGNVPLSAQGHRGIRRVAALDWRGRRARREQQRQKAINDIAAARYDERAQYVPTFTKADGQVVEGIEALRLMPRSEKEAFMKRAYSDGVEMDGGTVVIDGFTYRKTMTPDVYSVSVRDRSANVEGNIRFRVYRSADGGPETLVLDETGTGYPGGGFHRTFDFEQNHVYHQSFGVQSAFDISAGRLVRSRGRKDDPNLIDFRGGGFASTFNNNAFLFYRGIGLDSVKVGAAGDGKGVWPAQGFRDGSGIRLKRLNSDAGIGKMIDQYDSYESAIRRGERPTPSAILARFAFGDKERAENVRSMLIEGRAAGDRGDIDNIPGHHDYLNAMLPIDADGRMGRNQVAFNLTKSGNWDDDLSDNDRAALIAQVNSEMPDGIVLVDEDFQFTRQEVERVATSSYEVAFDSGSLDIAGLVPPRRPKPPDTTGGLKIAQSASDGYERFLAPKNGRAFAPEAVPVGSNGMDVPADAVRHIKNGGSLADVPDEFLKVAIVSNASRRAGEKRFRQVSADNEGGVNGMTRFLDQETGRYVGIKFGLFHSSQVDEAHNEMLGAALAERFGLGQGQVRFDGKGNPIPNPNNGNIGYPTPAIVVDLAQNYVDGDIDDAFSVLGRRLGVPERVSSLEHIPDPENRMAMAMMDLISGNTDRHRGNFMYTLDGSRVIPIDNGYGFAGGAYRDSRQSREQRMEGYLRSRARDQSFVQLAKTGRYKAEMVQLITKAQERLRANQGDGGFRGDIERMVAEGLHGPGGGAEFRATMDTLLENYDWFLTASPNEVYGMLERAGRPGVI